MAPPCPQCKGTGRDPAGKTCAGCGGTGSHSGAHPA